MLQLIGQTQSHRDHLRWLRRCGEGAQKFFARCLAGVSFRHRLRMGKFLNRIVAPLKLRARQLQQSEALYRHLIQDAFDGIFVVNRELRFIEVNEKFCEMAGCRREELLQSTLSEVLARAIVAEEHVRDLLGRRPLRGEIVIQPPGEFTAASSRPCCMPVSIVPALSRLAPSGSDGEFTSAKANGRSALPSEPLCHAQQNGCAHPNTNGTLSRRQSFPRTIDLNAAPINDELYMGIARDVTEKKHYEAELHRAAELRELLLRTMNDGIAVLDREGYLLIGNRAIEEILEMSQAELTQHRFTAFKNGWQFRTLDGKSLPEENNPIHLALNRQQRRSDVRLKISRPGNEKYLSVNAAPLYDERLQLIGAIVALRDITTTMQSEIASEVWRQKIQQTAKLVSLGELAAGVAHEINNPMTGIINYAQILYERAPRTEEKQLLLEGILRESERVTKIVHNLLTFARQQPQEQGWASLNEILDSSLHLLELRLQGDGVNVILEIPPNLPPLKCRSQQIQQVFINLLTNAHYALNEKYSGHHQNKVLKIAASLVQCYGRQFMRIEFYDAGIGIAPENLPKIFEPFFTTKGRSEGTGLGLSISYGIIKEHQGDIFVESRLGDHTTFVIELPVGDSSEAE